MHKYFLLSFFIFALCGSAEAQTATPTAVPTATPTPTPRGCYWGHALRAKDDTGQSYYALSPDRELLLAVRADGVGGWLRYRVTVRATGETDPAMASSCEVRLTAEDLQALPAQTKQSLATWILGRIKEFEDR